jgi:hypothetical protein
VKVKRTSDFIHTMRRLREIAARMRAIVIDKGGRICRVGGSNAQRVGVFNQFR